MKILLAIIGAVSCFALSFLLAAMSVTGFAGCGTISGIESDITSIGGILSASTPTAIPTATATPTP